MEEVVQALKVEEGRRSETMLAPQEVQKMLALQALGWGSKRISRELGCSRNTVRAYLREGGWRPLDTSHRTKALSEHEEWLAQSVHPRCPHPAALTSARLKRTLLHGAL